MAATLGTINPLRYRGYVYDQETGLYYLQSRYYAPEIGRFINGDGYNSTGQGFVGNNMFAYCGNNPVIFRDSAGTRYEISAGVGCHNATGQKQQSFGSSVNNWLVKRKEKAESRMDGTLTVGRTICGGFGIAGSVSIGLTMDLKGNVGIMIPANVGAGFPSASGGAFVSVNNAPEIFDQRGLGVVVGGSGGPGAAAIGAEYNMLINTTSDCVYHGGTLSLTGGIYPALVELHGEVGHTGVFGINLYDVAIRITDILMGN